MFEITDYYELIALNKALFEARYHANPDHREVPGSPFVAAMHERVLAAIFDHDKLPQSKIDAFLKWSDRTSEHDAVRNHLTNSDWCHMDSATQREFASVLVRPFVATDSEFDELVEFAQNEHDGKPCSRCSVR